MAVAGPDVRLYQIRCVANQGAGFVSRDVSWPIRGQGELVSADNTCHGTWEREKDHDVKDPTLTYLKSNQYK